MERARVCFVVGARPNFMKAAPVLKALAAHPDVETFVIHTGQHYDPELSEIFLEQLALPTPDVFLGVGSGTHGQQTARALVGIEEALLDRRPSLVLVPGDVNSTLAGALAAAKLGIPVAHLEAGLRSFDRTMPEELNRLITDQLSSLLLVHSESALDNLAAEGIDLALAHLVGNTMIDSLLEHLPVARGERPWERYGLAAHGYGLVTLHRPALVDDPSLLRETISALAALAETAPLVFPVHPRTLDRMRALGLTSALAHSGVIVTNPLGYLEFLGLEAEALFVLTDSGGVQEETTALGVRCFTLRDTTERPVTVELGTNTLLGLDPERIADIPFLLERPVNDQPVPLWDGEAGGRAASVLATFLEATAEGVVHVRH